MTTQEEGPITVNLTSDYLQTVEKMVWEQDLSYQKALLELISLQLASHSNLSRNHPIHLMIAAKETGSKSILITTDLRQLGEKDESVLTRVLLTLK